MPVSVLLCEGQSKSPDARLLRAVLAGIACEIKPSGGKYGFGMQIIARQEISRYSVIKGIMDRDFDNDTTPPINKPRDWLGDGGKIHFGWRWDRCEIENYLIDPMIVDLTLADKIDLTHYQNALNEAAQSIAIYTAARVALSVSRKRFSPLENSWGHQGPLNHKFPESLTEDDCRQGILQVLREYEDCQMVADTEIFDHFEAKLAECQPGGIRFEHFLMFFSGKDLLLAMRWTLERLGFDSPKLFRDRILFELENSSEDIWNWLPEWGVLRQLIQQE